MDFVTLDDITAAAERVRGISLRTPLLPAAWAGGLWLKPENLQPVGAFKIRGAANAVARLPESVGGVVTHSSGNHGRALGYAAARRGVACVVVAPDAAPRVKLEAMRATGAEVVVVPGARREEACAELAAERGLAVVPPYDHRDVIAGQGTIGAEIVADMSDVETVLVPIGGGGLASGVGVAVKALSPSARVIGVEPELAADTAEGFRAGKRVHWSVEDRYRTVADGVRVEPSALTFAHIRRYLDDVVTVAEDEILTAVGELARQSHVVAEPSGALTTAAYLRYGADWGRTVAVISGGNVDPEVLAECVSPGPSR
ncbi:MAG TPA: threonine/serine dehydratase [Stackebrandtia sp.]|jgi:threonine dehydratase|uniref:threonine ammonia-lyase n=1 Tax=Stackebrandtia sp. TaxID=2023065 RepID=UPI002D6386FA|nr:threonine/serine dehydratase [Stackebrandtia sp.]HZE39028.1 threonine/serine dehydratase [Stackebrandtia sp.]